jgi:Peptidase family M28
MIKEHQSLHALPKQAIILLIGVLMLVGIGICHTYPPNPALLPAPPTVFSSARAMTHVWQIGSKSHPTGSLENANVRRYLVNQLRKLGFEPEIQSALGVNPEKKQVGRIHNVLVRVPGTKPGKALLLAAHYDSVHTGPGAADDGASVAAILETLRAIKTQMPLQNDLLCIFTDGEEAGMIGAEAFVQQHPWAKTIGLALNFEYRGNRGAFMMFETSPGNGKLVEGLAASAPFLLANSLMYEVYKRLPNDTDMSVFKQVGIPGMNFAAIDGYSHYHTQLDRPEFLDEGSLQQEGDIMLALVKHFGNIPLNDLKSSDRVYFDLLAFGLVNYPVSWIMPLNALLLLLFATVMTSGVKTKTVRVTRILSSMIGFPVILVGLSAASHYLWLAIRQLHPDYESFLPYNSHWYLLAFVFLDFGLFGFLQVYVTKWLRSLEFSLGIMACWLLLLVFCSVWLPGVSFLLFWPLTAMLMVVGMLFLRKKNIQYPVNESLVKSFDRPKTNANPVSPFVVNSSNHERTHLTQKFLKGISKNPKHSFSPREKVRMGALESISYATYPSPLRGEGTFKGSSILIFLGSIPGILLFTPLIRGLFIALTPQMIALVVVFLVLLLGLLTPLLEMIGQLKWLIRSSLVLGLSALVAGSLTSGFDADHPRQNTLFYALNSSGQRAFWLSTDKQIDQWTSTFFPKTQEKQYLAEIFGDRFPAMWTSIAPVLPLQAPMIETLENSAILDKSTEKRKIKIRVKSSRQAPNLKVTIEGADVLQSKVAGQIYSQTPLPHWSLDSVGLIDEDLLIEFIVKAGIPFRVRAIDFSYGLPAAVLNHRPSSMISKPTEFSDTAAVVNVINYK